MITLAFIAAITALLGFASYNSRLFYGGIAALLIIACMLFLP